MELTSLANNPERLIAALFAAGTVAFIAKRGRALSLSGAFAATVVGSIIVAGSGWWCGGILVLYFVTSSALSKIRADLPNDVRQKRGNQRDGIQVLANGGIPALFAGIAWATGSSPWTLGAVCAIAAANADTWATEIGRLTQATPRSIVTWRPAIVGTSGAVSVPGTLASVAGSLVIAIAATIGLSEGWLEIRLGVVLSFAICTFAGTAGSLLDSLMGSTIQEMFCCERCGQISESSVDSCGSPSRRVSGIAGVNNDIVNLVGILVPAVVAIAIAGFAA